MTPEEFDIIDGWFKDNPNIKCEFVPTTSRGYVDLKLTSKNPKGQFEYVYITIELEQKPLEVNLVSKQ